MQTVTTNGLDIAKALDHYDITRLLNANLNEKKAADKKLSTVTVCKGVNRKAAS
jgi:ferritin-like metal-binding protein YciE